jgi:hypothetical protein
MLAIVAVLLAIPIFVTYFEQGIGPRIPTAILTTGLMLLAFLSIVARHGNARQARSQADRLFAAEGTGREGGSHPLARCKPAICNEDPSLCSHRAASQSCSIN